MACIHIIDDDATIREVLSEYFSAREHEVTSFASVEDGQGELISEQPEVLLLDVRLPGMDGLTFLESIQEKLPRTGVIMMTGQADYLTAVKAIKLGARDFISKPFSLSDVEEVVTKIIQENKKHQQLHYFETENRRRVSDMVGASPSMEKVYDFIGDVAPSSNTSVLIEGETGTGKGMVARAIHYRSPRSSEPFIEINCSAFQPTLLESELFGHEAGSFTGAKTRKKGLLEEAHGGTFFLDEVGDMSLELQSKVLKVLEEKSFRRVGGTKEIRVDTRIISATSRDLDKLVQTNEFRTDLYYRLHVASIVLPPLRERGPDILQLAEHYLGIFARELKKNIKGIEAPAVEALEQYQWVGNVRELRNVIERAVLFEKGTQLSLESIGLTETIQRPEASEENTTEDPLAFELPTDGVNFEDVEKAYILKAMERSRGNKSKAAKLLGFSRETMKYRLKKFKLDLHE